MDRGLILVTGPTGSGKSTTLACLLECINQTRHDKVITIEDPIEFVYTSKQSFVSQREVGQHPPNFGPAPGASLRQGHHLVHPPNTRHGERDICVILPHPPLAGA